MKHILTVLFFCWAFMAFAQNDEIQTLSKNQHNGFYTSLGLKTMLIRSEIAPILNGKMAWTIERMLGIGLEFNALIPVLLFPNPNVLPSVRVRPLLGYAGFFVEPIFFSNKLVHLTMPIGFGTGWAGYVQDWRRNNSFYDDNVFEQQVFWYFEPALNLELNLTRRTRFYVGASYRRMRDIQIFEEQRQEFQGINYQLGIKFGRF